MYVSFKTNSELKNITIIMIIIYLFKVGMIKIAKRTNYGQPSSRDLHYPVKSKVKVVPYTFVRRGVPVREGTYAEPSACEVGWPVPFVAAVISLVLPLGTHLLLGEQ